MATPPESVEMYCLKCRAKTGSRDVEQVTMKNGRPALRAVCSVCGTGKYRIGSARLNGDSRPWATRPQRRCSTGMGMPRRRNRRHGKVHRNKCWYHRKEQQDSRLIPPRSCPTDRVHLILTVLGVVSEHRLSATPAGDQSVQR